MKSDYLMLLVSIGVLAVAMVIGGVLSGDNPGFFSSGNEAYAQSEDPGHTCFDDNGDDDIHGPADGEGTETCHEGHEQTDGLETEPDCELHDHAVEPGDPHPEDQHAEGVGQGPANTGHDHADYAGREARDVHAEHGGHQDAKDQAAEGAHGAHENEGDLSDGEHNHTREDAVFLSPEAMRIVGVRVKRARIDRLHRTIELPGEIGFNEDRLVHITPRYAGVAREVNGRLGSFVREGDLLAILESNESLSRYDITAPISGRIIEKRVTAGEFVTEEQDMFLIADLSTVWANCDVYAKDMIHVGEGARVRIATVRGDRSTEAVLSYVAPVFDGETRSALARAVIANDGDIWRPGTFIRAVLEIEMETDRLTVDKDAVQTLVEEKVLFVPGDEPGEFRLVPVVTGVAGEHSVEIVSGIAPGTEYVASGAFELKAKMVTANMGAHAGHGH